jgi:para-nitrobenzyl esterase
MVWAHGGGQISGSGADNEGTHFAQEGVVLVTCNRRLGAEGYLYLEELFGDNIGPGNLGIQDLISVLEWVAENIQHFGGDPAIVTLFGASGGAVATQAVVATPGSEGLVHRAILQSGGHVAQRTDAATSIARYVIDKFAIKPGDIDSLRQVPWAQFISLYTALGELGDVAEPEIYVPVITEHMPHHPADAPYEGMGLNIDYLVGTCRDEANLFDALLPGMIDTMFHPRAKRVIEKAGLSWRQVMSGYATARPELDEDELLNAILGDMWFRVPSIRIAEGHASHAEAQTYMYLFEWESPLIGAAHGLDMMMFGNRSMLLSLFAAFADYEKTASFIRKTWTRFASVGSPALPHIAWPSYNDRRATMSINETPSILHDPFSAEYDLLRKVITANWRNTGL